MPVHDPPLLEPNTFRLRATELRALPDGRFQIVLELAPKGTPPQPKQSTPRQPSEASCRAS
jgi:hypothetical protein